MFNFAAQKLWKKNKKLTIQKLNEKMENRLELLQKSSFLFNILELHEINLNLYFE